LLFAFEPSTFTLLELRFPQGPEIFLEFSDHSFKFGYETNQITDLLNSWGYVGRNWGDGNGHFIRIPASVFNEKGVFHNARQTFELPTGGVMYCELVDCGDGGPKK
jgi:hypothetical protein